MRSIGLIVGVTAVVSVVGLNTQAAAGIDYNAEIKRLQAAKDANNGSRSTLQTEAQTMEQKLANLRATIAALDNQIAANETSRIDITRQIEATSQQIIQEQAILGQLVRQMYIASGVSSLEMVASSKNFSEYVEKEQYSLAMQTKVQQTLDRIAVLKKQQEAKKVLIEKLIADNKAMQAQVASEKQEVDRLLALNQEQQATYTQSIAIASTQISDLQRQQAEENLRFQREQVALAEAARIKAAQQPASARSAAPASAAAPAGLRVVNGAAYPYANAPFPNEISDPWGMYQRQCVSYTAWAVATSGRHMPYWGGYGNAKQWDDNARAVGIPVDSNPRVGDVAVSNRGIYGHVMYVEGVNGDGSINISQYNAGWDGRYSKARIFPADLVFIHF